MARQGLLLILLLLVVTIPRGQKKPIQADYKSIYRYAEELYRSGNATSTSDSLAIVAYHRVVQILSALPENDTILFDSYVKAAILEMTYRRDTAALLHFAASTDVVKQKRHLPDSLLFQPYLYAGSIHYSLFNFDSSLYYYRQAENIVNKYPSIAESERLYNKLGVLFFETGDYRKSIVYFEKALSIVEAQSPADISFIVNYKNNIASALRKLRRYSEALNIYKSLITFGYNVEELHHNIGVCYLDAGDAKQAIEFLERVKYSNEVKYNDLASAYIQLNKLDSATYFLRKAFDVHQKTSSNQKTKDYGITLKYEGDLLMAKHLPKQALQKYHSSIIQLDPDFNDPILEHNPASFYGLHNSFLLFNTIKAKAAAFAQTKDKQQLSSALDTYSSALALASHVEKMYHSDESKLFLEQNVSVAYKEAVKMAIQLFELTKDELYLKKAFNLAENSKASVLQTDLHDLELNNIIGLPQNLIREQNQLKANISKLNFQISQTTDTIAIEKLQNDLRDLEIQFSRLQDKLDNEPAYYQLKFTNKEVNIDTLQQKVLAKDEALISYYYYGNQLLCFYITRENFGYTGFNTTKKIFDGIVSLRRQLNGFETTDRKLISDVSTDLYNNILAPVLPHISGKKRLLVIPYNELSYIPFEALATIDNGRPLLYKFAVSYNYSANFLSTNDNEKSKYETLAIAPFTSGSRNESLPQLSHSLQEVAGLKGKILIDKEATKQQFLKFYDQFPVIHLATHARANDSIPLQSYIEFFATKPLNDTSHRLYEPEIYHLDMKKAQLVILSACETGSGQLINEEGIISLSRAFSYAGCKSVITSLWKADDAATAFIISKVHVYLQKGFPKDEALQKAKIDYLESNEIDARFKTPAYWAHLVLIGNNEPIARGNYTFYLLIAITIIIVSVMVVRKSRTK